MHDQLHNDGYYTIFKVQVQTCYPSGPEWHSWELIFAENKEPDPPIRFASKEDMYRGFHREPYQSYTASGECWQQTGIKGLFSFEKAQEMVTELRAFQPELRFRIVEMTIRQHTRVIGVFEPVQVTEE